MTAIKQRFNERLDALCRAGGRPLDASSMRLYRIGFGLIMALGMARLLYYGWIDELYLKPKLHFHYWPLQDLELTPGPWLYGVAIVGLVSALGIASGLKHRLSVSVFLCCFLTLELLDKTLYLNHYVLATWLLVLLWFMPLRRGQAFIPAWCLWLLRLQMATVYIHAALAKLTPDWLLRGQPLGMWLRARAESPILGQWFLHPQAGLVMSWAGMLFDLSVVWLLLWRPTRKIALALVVGFHITTWLLFPIGIFPWLMIVGATLFASPAWPKRLFSRTASAPTPSPSSPISRKLLLVIASFALFQALMPLRHLLYPGTVHWHEQGYRFSWKVMLNEKTGAATFKLTDPTTGRTRIILPSNYLSPLQEKMMSTQPDMILEFAHQLAREHQRQTGRWPQVRAEVWVSWNGRPMAPLIDPQVDLASREDGLMPYDWVLPAPKPSSR